MHLYHVRPCLELVQIVRPLLHHLETLYKVRSAVVCAPVRIAHGMGKLVFVKSECGKISGRITVQRDNLRARFYRIQVIRPMLHHALAFGQILSQSP